MSPLYCFTADDMARLRTGTFGFDISKIRAECADELEKYCLGTKEIVGMKRKPLYSCVMQAVRGYDTSEYESNRCYLCRSVYNRKAGTSERQKGNLLPRL